MKPSMAIGFNIPLLTSELLVETITVPRQLTGFNLFRSRIEDMFDNHGIGIYYPFRRVQRTETKTIPSKEVIYLGGKIICHPYYYQALKTKIDDSISF